MKNEIDETIASDFGAISPELFKKLNGKRILVTGATGLVGSSLIRYLLLANMRYDLKIHPIAAVRSEEKARAIFLPYTAGGDVETVVCDFADVHELSVPGPIDYVVHAAAITTSRLMVTRPVEVIQTSVDGTQVMLNLAHRKQARFLYISSMEVYGTMDTSVATTEDMLGTIGISSVRSGYPESKRLCELMCRSYLAEYGTDIVIARLAQTFGAGVMPGDNRVFMQFARSAMSREDIVLKTEGLSEGNYVYISDAIAALLTLLTNGKSGEAYNVCNEETHTTIREMAHLVSDVVSRGKSKVIIAVEDRGTSGYAQDAHLTLSSKKLQELGWKPVVDLAESYRRLTRYMSEQGF